MWKPNGIIFLQRCSYDDSTVTILWQRNMNVCNVICTKWLIHQCTFSVIYCLFIELFFSASCIVHSWIHLTVGIGHFTVMQLYRRILLWTMNIVSPPRNPRFRARRNYHRFLGHPRIQRPSAEYHILHVVFIPAVVSNWRPPGSDLNEST